MIAQVAVGVKTFHARFGHNAVFGMDVDKRKIMTIEEATARFDSVWKNKLANAVSSADSISCEDARKDIPEKYHDDVTTDFDYVAFRLLGARFIAQLRSIDNSSQEMTRLWYIPSSNRDPRTLYVTFQTVEIREQFRDLAQRLRWDDNKLGEQLLLDFMAKFEGPPAAQE